MVRLNRIHIYLILILALASLQFIPKILVYANSNTTTGIVVDIDKVMGALVRSKFSSHRSTNYVPTAQCVIEAGTFLVRGPAYPDLEMCDKLGDKVTIIYNKNDYSTMQFLSITDFWFPRYMLKLVFLFVITIALFSFIHQSQFVIFRWKKDSGEKIFELTKSVKDSKLKARLDRARLAMLRRPRH